MGLPRASGKRPWSGTDMADESCGPTKALCTSPPHAICAEDVVRIGGDKPCLSDLSASQPPQPVLPTEELETSAPCTDLEGVSDVESDVDFIDDEEDKDSGFIDGNSVENSSDEESEPPSFKDHSFEQSDSVPVTTYDLPFSRSLSTTTTTTSVVSSSGLLKVTTASSSLHVSTAFTSLQSTSTLSYPCSVTISSPSLCPNKVQSLPNNEMEEGSSTISQQSCISQEFSEKASSSSMLKSISLIETATSSQPLPSLSSLHDHDKELPESETPHDKAQFNTDTSDQSSSSKAMDYSDSSMTTVTAAQTCTIVTSAYQGSVSSPAYDPASYPVHFTSAELYHNRPGTPPIWSCNFYDGSHPTTTNKYMEISSPGQKQIATSQQSIQCDENGKSYLELGSASPYTPTYTNECGNFTTSPSTYPGQAYTNQTFTTPTNYNQANGPYYNNNRQAYSPNPYAYSNSESYYDSENNSYNYSGNYRGLVGSRLAPRCSSPFCDPTVTSPRASCYQQQRISVLNLSMIKLNRFSRYPEPNLHRSVLICNTLRHIEREMESEGINMTSLIHSQNHNSHLALPPHPGPPSTGLNCSETMPSNHQNEGPLPSMHPPLTGSPPPPHPPPSTSPLPSHSQYGGTTTESMHYDYADHPCGYGQVREESRLGRPFPPDSPHVVTRPTDRDLLEDNITVQKPVPLSPTEEKTEGINWCSVLSLSSQTDLDSMNNNEYGEWSGSSSPIEMDYSSREETPAWKLPSLSADDVLKTFPESSKKQESSEDIDTIMNNLVDS